MKTIIVPTDFSENAVNAVKYAIQMSKMHYYKLVFTHVYSLPFLSPEAGMVYDASLSDALRIQTDKALRTHIDEVYESLDMHRNLLLSELEVVEAISIAGGIEKIDEKYNANMVIMGTHGATGLKKFFLGSNAVEVIDNIQLPVLTIPNHFQFNEIKAVAYASDFTDITNELKQVVEFAEAFNATVEVIHVTNESGSNDNESSQNIETDPIISTWRNAIQYKKIGLHLLQANEKSNTDESLKSLLSEINVDVLVMFHQHRNFWKSLFEKSTTAELVYEWSNPILSMHKQ